VTSPPAKVAEPPVTVRERLPVDAASVKEPENRWLPRIRVSDVPDMATEIAVVVVVIFATVITRRTVDVPVLVEVTVEVVPGVRLELLATVVELVVLVKPKFRSPLKENEPSVPLTFPPMLPEIVSCPTVNDPEAPLMAKPPAPTLRLTPVTAIVTLPPLWLKVK